MRDPVMYKYSTIFPIEVARHLLRDSIRGVFHIETEIKGIAEVARIFKGAQKAPQGSGPIVRNDVDIHTGSMPVYPEVRAVLNRD
jgi:hypothetical protein